MTVFFKYIYTTAFTQLQLEEPDGVSTILDVEFRNDKRHCHENDNNQERGSTRLDVHALDCGNLGDEQDGREGKDGVRDCNDLRLDAELVRVAANKVRGAALAIARDVGHLADAVEHVAGGEEQDGDERDGDPELCGAEEANDLGVVELD